MLNSSETMPTQTFTLSLPESVTRVFNLHVGKDGSNQCYSPRPSAEERLVSICSVACDVVRYNTPRLTEAQWVSILSAVQAGACGDWSLELRQVTNRSSGRLTTMIYDDECYDSEDDLHTIMRLTAVERFAAFFVADRFWRNPGRGILREVLAEYSDCPRECVFADDPEVRELWAINSVQWASESNATVELCFANDVDLTCQLQIENNGGVILENFKVSEGRCVTPPEVSPESYFLRLSLEALFPAHCH